MIQCFRKQSVKDPFHQVRSLSDGLWVHVNNPTEDEIAQLVDYYKLDSHIVRDVNDMSELPRSERSGNSIYVFLRPALRSKHGEVTTSPLLAVVTPHAFLTIGRTNALEAATVIAAGEGRALRTDDRAAMLLLTLNAITRQYQDLLSHTGNYIQDIKHKLRNHEVGNKDFIHFVTIEDNLNEYQFCLQDTLAVTEHLKDNNHDLFSDDELEALDDAKLYIKQLISAVNSHIQSIASIRNAYSTIANNTLNLRMKTLTVFTVLIALPNVFYGMYGMNVPLPFQDSPWAYVSIVLFTIALILGVYAIAKRFRLF